MRARRARRAARAASRARGDARRRLDGPKALRRERRRRIRVRPAVDGRVVEQLALRAEQRVSERHADRPRGLLFHRVRVGGAVHAHGAFLLEPEPRVPADDAFGSRQALVHLVHLVRVHRVERVVVLHVRVLKHFRQALANRHRARIRVARQRRGRAPHLVAAGAAAVEHRARHFPPDDTDTAPTIVARQTAGRDQTTRQGWGERPDERSRDVRRASPGVRRLRTSHGHFGPAGRGPTDNAFEAVGVLTPARNTEHSALFAMERVRV